MMETSCVFTPESEVTVIAEAAAEQQLPEHAVRRMAGFFLRKMQADLLMQNMPDESQQG